MFDLKKIDKRMREYFSILEPNFPKWLYEYINTDIVLKQQYISITCGTIYTDLFQSEYFYSSMDHAIGVALIVWHFTHDKKQTLAGLFHDIATPVFKHCIDYMNEDYESQESTEELTTRIISESEEVMKLLERDNIKVEEIDDYHKYPIADNDTPQLSSDRLEYTLSNALFTYEKMNIDGVREIYNDISIQTNDEKIEELGFNHIEIIEKFMILMSELAIIYIEDRNRYSFQFIADIMKKLSDKKVVNKADLYNLKESEIIKIIEDSEYGSVYKTWKKAKKVNSSNVEPEKVYYVHHGTKIRYMNPLLCGTRIDQISNIAKNEISKIFAYDMSKYVYLDLNF